jgi:hypothetical protein
MILELIWKTYWKTKKRNRNSTDYYYPISFMKKIHMYPTHPITLLLLLLTLPLQAQNPCVSQSVLDAKKRIVQQLKANQTTCTWNFALYKEKKVGDKIGLYTHTEKEILPPEFKDILGPPYSWFVLAKKMGADKYSLYNMAGSQLAESAYYSVLRIANSACAVEAIDETDAACRDDSYTFSLNYLCSYYLARIDNGKQGLFNSDYETLLPFEFSKIIHAGGSRFITSTGGWPATFDLVDVETQQTLLKDAESIQVSFVDQAKTHLYDEKYLSGQRSSLHRKKERKMAVIEHGSGSGTPESLR